MNIFSTIQVQTDSNTKRASHRGAFFVAGFVISIFVSPVLAKECPADRIDETVTVDKVVDGDTLRLKDGRLIRIIGINTPEFARDGKPAEPLAEQAYRNLKKILGISLLKPNSKVGLRYGSERKDRHGRTLAHVFTQDGSSVEAGLLSVGLAAQIVVPPNTWNLQCYRAVEREARLANKGVWASYYRPISVDKIARDFRGFRIISGKVVRVGESKRSIWLNFPRLPGEGSREGVAVRISRKDLAYFKRWNPKQLEGKQVIVRGWMYPYKKQLVMQIRHPNALYITTDKKIINP